MSLSPTNLYILVVLKAALINTHMIYAILNIHEKGNMGKIGLECRAIAPVQHLNLITL